MARKKRRITKLNFKSKKNYRKWLAWGHIHLRSFGRKPTPKVLIRGKPHKVKRHKR